MPLLARTTAVAAATAAATATTNYYQHHHRSAFEIQTRENREIIEIYEYFHGRFEIPASVIPEHVTSKSVVLRATDRKGTTSAVVIKLMNKKHEFDAEIKQRKGLDSRFVVNVLHQLDPSKDEELKKRWERDLAR